MVLPQQPPLRLDDVEANRHKPGNFTISLDGTLVQGAADFYNLLGGGKSKDFPDLYLEFSHDLLEKFEGDFSLGRSLFSRPMSVRIPDNKVLSCYLNAVILEAPTTHQGVIQGSVTPAVSTAHSLLEDDIMKSAYSTSELRIWVVDNQQKLLRYNRAFERHIRLILDRKARSLETVQEFFPASYHRPFANVMENIRQGIAQTLEVQYKVPGQDEQWSELTLSPITRKGHVMGALVVEKDVSMRKRSEDQVADLALVANKTGNSVMITTGKERIEWVNDGFQKMTGYTFTEVVGKSPREVLYGRETDPAFLKKMGEAMETETNISGDVVKYRKDGRPIWVHMNMNPVFNELGQLTKWVVVENEITRRKKMETMLVAAKEQALRLSQEKEQFLSVVSHELRNPLNALIGLTQLLMQRQPREDQLELLENIKFSEDNLLNLINDILDFSKIEAGKITFEKTEYHLPELVEGIAKMYSFTASQKGIELFSVIEPEVPTVVSGDPVRLNQIITNLVSNAIKFTERGYVKLRVSLIDQVRDKANLLFEVEDTGIGIPPERVGLIFEKYQQASKSTTRTHGGTGLGLAISRQLVELQGGEITVSSQVNRGSSFSFNIPTDVVDEATLRHRKQAEESDFMPFDQLKVLLAEDNRINQLVAFEFMRQWNIEVITADHGADALTLAEQQTFDLILMDLQMPTMDGFEAIARIRKLPNHQETPIIALTGFTEDATGKLDRALIDGMLTKPFSPKQLHGMIQRFCVDKIHLEGRKLIQQGESMEAEGQDQINLDALLSISKGDQGFLDQVLSLYEKQFARVPKQLRDAMHFNEWNNVRQILHKINPSLHLLQNQKVISTITDIRQAIQDDANKDVVEQKINYLLLLLEKLEELLKQKVAEMNQVAP